VNSVGNAIPAKVVLPVNCKCRYKCSEVSSSEDRGSLCSEYYLLGDFCRQKDCILRNIVVRSVKTRKVISMENGKEDFSQSRQNSVSYYLENAAFRHRVCKSFFMKTLHKQQSDFDCYCRQIGFRQFRKN